LFKLHPEYSKLPFYTFGESYAGKYLPALTHHIWVENQQSGNLKINLQGIGMGDGWVDPYYQTGSYAEFLYAHQLIDDAEYETAEATYEAYKTLIDLDLYLPADDVGNILLESLVAAAGNVDVYDIRYIGGDPTDPLGAALQIYLNQPSVQAQMNAGNQTWQMCSNAPGFALLLDIEQSVANLLPDLLSSYQVMNYNGNFDLICNYMGTIEWTSNIGWPGQQSYNSATNHTWVVNGKTAGYYKTGGNLTHVVVYNAGHMSPFDQPQNTQAMLYQFIAGAFSSKPY